MKIDELPKGERIALTYSESELAEALARAGEAYPFSYFQPVYGAPRSVRLLSQEAIPGAVELPENVCTHEGLAEDFMRRLIPEARYDPVFREDAQKGWEVWATEAGGKPAAIVWAAWVPSDQLSLNV
ncbi:MAG TPA: hypothetical protein VHD37_00780 [Candidatus Paceibacterota bacterium]|nr:hypothetical protein [Candidatus Paceibacterota bacterium]